MDYNLTIKQKETVNPILARYGEVIIPHSIRFAGDTPWVITFKTYNKIGHVFIYTFNFNFQFYQKTEMETGDVSKFINF